MLRARSRPLVRSGTPHTETRHGPRTIVVIMLTTLTAVTNASPAIAQRYDREDSCRDGFHQRLRQRATITMITAVTPGNRSSFESGSSLGQNHTTVETSNQALAGALNHITSDMIRRRPYC